MTRLPKETYFETDSAGNITISLGRKVRRYDRDTPYITGFMDGDLFRVLYVFVPESLRGRGLGRLLVTKAYESIGARRVVPYEDLTPEGEGFAKALREKEGLRGLLE